ncbi:MAG TPA: OB-fold domain-containing protein [Acidimicrobiales bacterium]|nr:OB-fold domain-containing protein [Acidimicrobiales bacterium]
MGDNQVASETIPLQSARPRPVITPETAPFWRSVHEHRLELPMCVPCARHFFPPSKFCPQCWSDSVVWKPVRGTGTILTYVTFRRLYDPSFADLLPYSTAVIELDEGPRLLSRVTGTLEASVGARVEVVFEELDDETTLPLFQVTRGAP